MYFSKNRGFIGVVLAGVLLVTKAKGAICQCQTSEGLTSSLNLKKQLAQLVWGSTFKKDFVMTLVTVGVLALFLFFVRKQGVEHVIGRKLGVYNADPFQTTFECDASKILKEAEEAKSDTLSNQIILDGVQNIDYDKLEELTEEDGKFINFLKLPDFEYDALKKLKEAEEAKIENEKIKQNFEKKGINIDEYYEKNYGYIPVDGDYRNPTPLSRNQVPEVNDNNEESGTLSNQIIIDGIQNIDYNKLEGLTEEEKKFINFLGNAVLKGNNEKEDNNNIVNNEIDEEVVLFKVCNSYGDREEKTIELCTLLSVLRESAEKWIKYKNDPENIDLGLEEEDYTSFINLFSRLLFTDRILVSYKDGEGLWNYFKDEDIEIDYDSLEGLTSQERHFIRFLQSKKGGAGVMLSVCNKSVLDKLDKSDEDLLRLDKIEFFAMSLKQSLNRAARKWCNTEDKGNMSFIDLLSSEIPSLKGGEKTFKETNCKRVDGKLVFETVEKTEIAEDKVVFSYEDDGKIFHLKEEFMVDYRDLLDLSDEEKKFVYFLNTTKEKSIRGQIYGGYVEEPLDFKQAVEMLKKEYPENFKYEPETKSIYGEYTGEVSTEGDLKHSVSIKSLDPEKNNGNKYEAEFFGRKFYFETDKGLFEKIKRYVEYRRRLEEKDFDVEDLKTALRETADIWIKEKGVDKSKSGFNDVSFIELFSSKCKALNGKTLISYKDNIEDWQFFYIKLEGLTDNEIEFLRLLQNKYEGDYVNIKVRTYSSNYKKFKEEIVEIDKQTIVSLKQAARNWMNTENKANLSFIELLSKELFYREDILISYKDGAEWKSLEDGSEINGKSFEQDKNEDNLLDNTFISISGEN